MISKNNNLCTQLLLDLSFHSLYIVFNPKLDFPTITAELQGLGKAI